MSPRKSDANWTGDESYQALLLRLCREEDVLILPELVATWAGQTGDSTQKSKDFRASDEKPQESSEEDSEPEPPHVYILFRSADGSDSPLAITCRNIYLEYSLLQAIGRSLSPFPSLDTLKIEGCCLEKELAGALAALLADEPGKQITDLSLDGNEGLGQVLPLFLSLPNGLRCLSLERCGLDDEDVKLLSGELAYFDDRESKLLVLNLQMNKIGNAGAEYLAGALRSNRTLTSLSLAGNRIGDVGAAHLAEVLQRFPLTPEEASLKRRKVFRRLLKGKLAVDEFLGEWKSKTEMEKQATKARARSVDKTAAPGATRRVRGPDGKLCLSSRDKRARGPATKINSGERFAGKSRGGSGEVGEPPGPESPGGDAPDGDRHPFLSEVTAGNGELWCDGCWSLFSLNLAYNYLTEKSVEKFSEVLANQCLAFRYPKWGLSRLILQPGNLIRSDSVEVQNLNASLLQRQSRKELADSSCGIVKASPRRLSSARRTSLRGKTLEE